MFPMTDNRGQPMKRKPTAALGQPAFSPAAPRSRRRGKGGPGAACYMLIRPGAMANRREGAGLREGGGAEGVA